MVSAESRIQRGQEITEQTLIDSGAEINVIDEVFAKKSNITIVHTQECAEADRKSVV